MNRPQTFKTYPAAPVQLLPRALVASELSAVEVLSGVKGRAAPLDLALLGTLLFLADGVVRVMRTPEGEDVWFRSAMSAGNLHPVEMYVISDALGGVYHYDPLGHELALVRPRRRRNGDDDGGITVVLSGVPLRTCWRYGARGWRHLWWDAGTVLANILAVSDAHGLDAGLVTSFADADVSEVIGCESVDEVPLVVVRLGPPGRLWSSASELGPAEPSMPVSSRPLAMPQVDAFQLAGNLMGPDLSEWRQGAQALAREVPEQVGRFSSPLPQPRLGAQDRVEDVVLRRGSLRSFGYGPAPGALLTWVLAVSARPARFDVCPSGSLISMVVNVHDVDGFEPGTYRFTPGPGLERQAVAGPPRLLSAELCLGQQRAGDASWTGFHVASAPLPADKVGGRAYRLALLEAGIRAGRLSLAACALGGGATGMTIDDRQVRVAFGLNTLPLLATSVGLRSSPPPPSGTPGSPVEIRARNRPGL